MWSSILKGLFTQISWATGKHQTCELGAEELVMSEIQGTYKRMVYRMWINSILKVIYTCKKCEMWQMFTHT